LQVLEDGHLTDAVGKKVNFKNTIVIMTSNVGLQNLNKGAIIGFEAKTTQDKKEAFRKYNEIKEQVMKELERKFRPEFLNRIDKIIVFKPLELDSIEKIVELEIKELTDKLSSQNIKLIIDKQTVKHIAKISYKPEQGARAVRRTVQELIENPLAQGMLENKFKAGDTVKTKIKGQTIELTK
jgi:ATP-dependent Clp protease ATP-binding subunit ClpC